MITTDGVRITRTAAPFDPAELGRVAALADERRGGVMSSGMEYPGRYSRWVMAYADPCAEIIATGLRITARALNDRGRVLMPVIRAALRRAGPSVQPVDEDTVFVAEGGPGAHRGRAQPQADGVHRAAGGHRGVRLPGPAPGPVRGVRLRPGVPVRAGAAAPGTARDATGPGPAPAGRDLDHGPDARGGGQVLLRVRGGRRVHGRAGPHDGTHRPGARPPARSGDRTAGTAAGGELCAGRGGGQGAVRLRRPVRGRAEPRLLRAVRVAGRLLRAAPAA